MPNAPATLYHYTRNSTFHAMIKYQTIRLSSLNLSNDSMEGKWASDTLFEVCCELGIEPVFVHLLKERIDDAQRDLHALGLCLTTEEDMLSQWRGYADDGQGFCIGFNRPALAKIALKQRGAQLYAVQYDRSSQLESMREAAAKIAELVKRGALSADRQKMNHMNTLFAEVVRTIRDALSSMYQMKNPAFREEKEWRILSFYDVGISNLIATYDYEAGVNKIYPFQEITVSKDDAKLLIDTVYIGPRNITPPELIQGFIERYWEVNVAVERSSATYR